MKLEGVLVLVKRAATSKRHGQGIDHRAPLDILDHHCGFKAVLSKHRPARVFYLHSHPLLNQFQGQIRRKRGRREAQLQGFSFTKQLEVDSDTGSVLRKGCPVV